MRCSKFDCQLKRIKYEKSTFTFPCSFIGFYFLSCEKNQEEVLEFQPSSEATTTISEKIVFHYSRLDLATNTRNGFIIDKRGYLRTYSFTPEQSAQLPESVEWTEEEIEYLYYSAGQSVLNIDKEELFDHYLKIEDCLSGKLVQAEEEENEERSISYTAFTSVTTTIHDGNCELGGGQTYNETIYTPRLLKISGSDNRMNDSFAAAELIEWMNGLVEKAGL